MSMSSMAELAYRSKMKVEVEEENALMLFSSTVYLFETGHHVGPLTIFYDCRYRLDS
jgi:hypothetical protein